MNRDPVIAESAAGGQHNWRFRVIDEKDFTEADPIIAFAEVRDDIEPNIARLCACHVNYVEKVGKRSRRPAENLVELVRCEYQILTRDGYVRSLNTTPGQYVRAVDGFVIIPNF